MLALTDGLHSYSVLETIADCKVENVNGQKAGFYNLNTVNNLHSLKKAGIFSTVGWQQNTLTGTMHCFRQHTAP